jgi:hypothetical protein
MDNMVLRAQMVVEEMVEMLLYLNRVQMEEMAYLE